MAMLAVVMRRGHMLTTNVSMAPGTAPDTPLAFALLLAKQWHTGAAHCHGSANCVNHAKFSGFYVVWGAAGVVEFPEASRRRARGGWPVAFLPGGETVAVETTDKAPEEMASADPVIHLAPTHQPTSVHETADRLLPSYTVDGGTVHLAGCRLDDRLFVRARSGRSGRTVEFHLDEQGEPLDPARVERLGMYATETLAHPPEPAHASIERLRERAAERLAQHFPPEHPPEQIDVAAIWCKWASGKVRFTIGALSADVPFAGWARTLEPPPYVCPATGVKTFHVGATDDGRIVAAERIGVCDQTGRRTVVDELVTCSATGRRVLAELADVCPVTGKPVLKNEMIPCATCAQRVAPAAVAGGECAACRGLAPVVRTDPRLSLILDRHPVLESWRHWRMAETARVFVLTARGWLRRVLVVVDKESLDLKRGARGHRLLAGWQPVAPDQYDCVLRR